MLRFEAETHQSASFWGEKGVLKRQHPSRGLVLDILHHPGLFTHRGCAGLIYCSRESRYITP